ncbi:hypothetical protein, partial [Propionicimonas sp.]|uniref:hypothetical protein n=1 Tax=Propionicimonas sp. TaxID=1955623 RepID=UPI0039E2A085
KSSLMKHSRDRSKVGSPTAYDKANVNYCFDHLPSKSAEEDGDTLTMVADYPTYDTLDDAVAAADVVVRGTWITSADDVLEPDVSNMDGDAASNPQFGATPTEQGIEDLQVPVTTSTVEVNDVLKGSIQPGQSIQVRQLGGKLDGVTYRESSTTLLADSSSSIVLLLLSRQDDGTYEMISTADGGWAVEGDQLSGLNGEATSSPFSRTSLSGLSKLVKSIR